MESLNNEYDEHDKPTSVAMYVETTHQGDDVQNKSFWELSRHTRSSSSDVRPLKVQKRSRSQSARSVRSARSGQSERSGRSVRSHASSAGSRNSGVSAVSVGSALSKASRTSRRGRRRWTIEAFNNSDALQEPDEGTAETAIENDSGCAFSCTFCSLKFKKHYDWKRHEESIHVPRVNWICNWLAKVEPATCPYDGIESPTEEHMALHNHLACIKRPESERTYLRADYLKQHLRGMHGVTDTHAMSQMVKDWRIELDPLPPLDTALHCGFCGIWLTTWEDRVAHVASHFDDRSEMIDWWPARQYHQPTPLLQSVGDSNSVSNILAPNSDDLTMYLVGNIVVQLLDLRNEHHGEELG